MCDSGDEQCIACRARGVFTRLQASISYQVPCAALGSKCTTCKATNCTCLCGAVAVCMCPLIDHPQVGIIMGSDSDLPTMKAAEDILHEFGVPCELTIVSAHRTPDRMMDYARTAHQRGLQVRGRLSRRAQGGASASCHLWQPQPPFAALCTACGGGRLLFSRFCLMPSKPMPAVCLVSGA